MRVGIDAHMIGAGETGNETYCLGLIEGLAELGDGNSYYVYLKDKTLSIEDQTNLVLRSLESRGDLWRLTVGLAQSAYADRLDLLHVTYNGPVLTPCPFVVSVHDISYAHFPEFFSKRDLRLLRAYVPYSIRRANRVLTLSESAASDIEHIYGVHRSKIVVVPLAARAAFTRRVNPSATQDILAKYGLKRPYVVAVGNLQPRKNLVRLVEAFARLPGLLNDLQLVIVGKALWKASEVFQEVARLGLTERVIFTGYVSDRELALIYNAAIALVYPSLYEGFGLPILEAMACGTPVICSNTSSMPDVAGDSALLIDPMSVGEISEAVAAVAQSAALRRELSQRGLRRSRLFSWQETARQTVSVYEDCIASKSTPTSGRFLR